MGGEPNTLCPKEMILVRVRVSQDGEVISELKTTAELV